METTEFEEGQRGKHGGLETILSYVVRHGELDLHELIESTDPLVAGYSRWQFLNSGIQSGMIELGERDQRVIVTTRRGRRS